MRTPWRALLRRAAALGLGPADFWRLSLVEWRALTECEGGLRPMGRAAFEAMAMDHPDEAR
ncbi:MAG: phage tail assembly chaperone [Pseudomonadota bacterium]